MKRGSRFLIALITAALTFGSLMAFVGPQKSGWYRYSHGYDDGCYHHHYYHHDYREEHGMTPDSNIRTF